MTTYLITGCSRGRGLGLAMLKHLSSKPSEQVGTIIATARQQTPALKKVVDGSAGRIVFVALDITDVTSTKKAAAEAEHILHGKGLDVLVNNAAIHSYSPNGIQEMDDLDNVLHVNIGGTHNVTRAFIPLLEKGKQKKIINISSTVGSFGMAERYAPLPYHGYKISKTGLNMLTYQYAHSFAEKGFTVVAISPGWLKTDLGGSIADLPPETGAEATLNIVFRVQKEDNGKFYNIHVPGWENHEGINAYAGEIVPW
ncbi:short-chain dehydrogenase-like protein [Xylona heveae TC161]|uniref:Short-chain dehydrogenase-like protein n=1 Tax=Xylona heveae (strain CBS 132557 / TC161) TaxID=1328760 RepID=A0A165HDT1_XYLHT|nr:short-chain dehydrogenase-like protein [Xylona heveae TC161]KZF23355.1 short-chain dehydrogenase-like protein [Xylona heveae TC161]